MKLECGVADAATGYNCVAKSQFQVSRNDKERRSCNAGDIYARRKAPGRGFLNGQYRKKPDSQGLLLGRCNAELPVSTTLRSYPLVGGSDSVFTSAYKENLEDDRGNSWS